MIIVLAIGIGGFWYSIKSFKEIKLFGGRVTRKHRKHVRKMVQQNKDWSEIEQYLNAVWGINIFAQVSKQSTLDKIKANIEMGLIK